MSIYSKRRRRAWRMYKASVRANRRANRINRRINRKNLRMSKYN